jgi:hypothetical protein
MRLARHFVPVELIPATTDKCTSAAHKAVAADAVAAEKLE